MIRVLIKDKQGKEYVQSFADDLQAQAVVLIAQANGCEAKILGSVK